MAIQRNIGNDSFAITGSTSLFPSLVVDQPPNNLIVQPNQPFLVTGQVSNQWRPGEPIVIESVRVQVDGGPLIEAILTHIPNKTMTLVRFKVSARVTGGQDPHTVTITATNDEGLDATKTVSVFTGPIIVVDAPALEIDIRPFPQDPNDPKIQKMLSRIQRALTPLSASLSSVGMILAGPNLVVVNDPSNVPVGRMGLWIEDATFPVVPPAPPDFPLPRLLPTAAAAGFNTVPLLPVPDPSGFSPAFALSIPVTTLQHLLDAVTPTLKEAAKQQGKTLKSITVQTFSPGSVLTSFSGDLPLGIPFTINITENLGTKPLPDSRMVPAVIGSSHSTNVGDFLDWFIGVFFPIFGLALLAAWGDVSSTAGQIAGQIIGIAAPLIAGIPSRIPFSNADLPSTPLPLPDFPVLVLDWRSFGVTDSGIVGTGTTTIESRDESIVSVAIQGSDHIVGYQEDLAGGAGQGYNFTLVNLAPDADKFKWQIFGKGSDGGSIDLAPFDQSGSFGVDFPLPFNVKPGKYPFTLAVNATETCGSDPSKTLSASNAIAVQVEVKPNPKTPP